MKLREYVNRFKDGNLIGAILYIQNEMAYPMVLKMVSKGCAWFMDKEAYPSGEIKIIEIEPNSLLDLPVLGWVNRIIEPLMEGDYIHFVDKDKERVTKIKEGDGSPFPIVTESGQYRWSEIIMVSKNNNSTSQRI